MLGAAFITTSCPSHSSSMKGRPPCGGTRQQYVRGRGRQKWMGRPSARRMIHREDYMPFIHGSPSASSRNWTQPYAVWRDSNAGAFFADRGSSLSEYAAPGSPAHGPFCPVPCAGSGGDLPLPLLPPSCHHPPSSPVGGEFSREQTHQEDDGHRPHPTHHRHGGPGHSCHHHRRLEKHFLPSPEEAARKFAESSPMQRVTNRDQQRR